MAEKKTEKKKRTRFDFIESDRGDDDDADDAGDDADDDADADGPITQRRAAMTGRHDCGQI